MKFANRINNLPPYLFAQIDKKIAEKRAAGVDVISLGIGDPDLPTPQNIIDKLCEEAANPVNHRYPSYYGLPDFRRAIADWYKRRFDVELDPDTEVLPLIGSKEGIAHISLTMLDPGDVTLVADPGYPVYHTGTILAGAESHFLPLTEDNDFLPRLDLIPEEIVARSKQIFLNYPNNPTSAIAPDSFYTELIAWAKSTGVMVAHDNPYSELTYDGYVAPSFLQYPGGKDVGIEFHSLSKTYNMTGWRIGWACGNAKVIEALGTVKSNIDSGIFNAIQRAGIEAFEGPQDIIAELRRVYTRRRDIVISALSRMGLKARIPKATIYVWVRVPDGFDSAGFATHALERTGVVVPPGSGYGPSGEGYIRISLTIADDRLEEAMARIEQNL